MVERPRKFTMPSFTQFDGTGDPFRHLDHYAQKMALDDRNDPWLCKVFPTSLTGAALEWFKNRPHRSLRRQEESMIARGELANYLTVNEYVKPREVNPCKVEDNQVKVIHARHGRSENDQESEEVYRSRLRVAHKLRRLTSVNTIASGSISIGFSNSDLSRVQLPYEDPLVISLLVANCVIKRALIDLGSSANIITRTVFEQLGIPSFSIRPTSNPLMGFDGTKVDPLGVVDLSVTVAKRTLKENFVLTEIHPSYNLIMGRGWIHRMNGVPSTLHQVMQCLSPDGKEVINLWGNQVAAKECYMLTQGEANKVSKPPQSNATPRDTTK
ncbi:uncharacterized protein LOC132304753 [Cornus florida]|uniref:uncharacterized protein LOC132304753 n=1 Tax=Cornus florida TaxID=4283 RepID=UPI00289F451B|nr:uncharacterized protein LOC132304753 [Cornus florida]